MNHPDTPVLTKPDIKRPGLWGYWLAMWVPTCFGLMICLTILVGYAGQLPILRSSWFCGGDQLANYGCSDVFASRYGRILGVPLPAFGAIYFLSIVLWLSVFGRRAFNLLFLLILAGGTAASIAMLSILYLVLHAQCRWCLMVHVCNFALIAIGSWGTYRFLRSGQRVPFRTALSRAVVVGLVVTALIGWVMTWFFSKRSNQLENLYVDLRVGESYQTWMFQAQTPAEMNLTAGDHRLGPDDARVSIVMYKDFQCDACAGAWQVVYGLYQEKYASSGNVALIVRHWPYSTRCNPGPAVGGDIHPYACRAAYAVEAAGLVDGESAFWKYHQLLADNHAMLDRNPYLELAVKIGLDRDAFLKAWQSDSVRHKVKDDIEFAQKLKISGVPTVFVNGRRIEISPRPQDAQRSKTLLAGIIDQQLNQPSTPSPAK